MTNYENLILTIGTDGSITPKDALEQSTKILIDHFNFILNQESGEKKVENMKSTDKESEEKIKDEEGRAEEEKEEKAKKRGRPKKEEKEEDKE